MSKPFMTARGKYWRSENTSSPVGHPNDKILMSLAAPSVD